MTIESLKIRFQDKTKQFANPNDMDSKFIKPYRLNKTVADLERRFDELENTQPLEEKIFRSLLKLKQHGKDYLTKRDWKNLAWSLSKVMPNQQEKVLFTDDGRMLLEQFSRLTDELVTTIYFPLLYSYFAVEQQDINKLSKNWLQLRELLSSRRSKLFQLIRRPKPWLMTLTDYPDILSTQPTKSFIAEFLDSKDSSVISKRLESLQISANSWFWDDLINTAVASLQSMNDDDYFKAIPRFLALLENNPVFATVILAALLQRYASSSQRTVVHEVLKQLALQQWGNPQYDSSAGWNNVNFDTKQMVIQWFVRADLEAFFTVFSDGADKRRFKYWLRFIKQVTFSEIFLNEEAMYYPNRAQEEFKKNNVGRYKQITGNNKPANAFMIKIGGFYIVEFSKMNNATYFYRAIPYPNSQATSKIVNVSSLKSTGRSEFYLSHNGAWESSFDRRLHALGIFPD